MSFPERHIAIVCNPARKKSSEIAEDISLLLTGMDVDHSLFTGDWPIDWKGFSEVWIVGGDGTLNHFINQNPDIKIPLVIFKGGTGNDFHWMLYGDISIEDQVEKVLLGKKRQIDAGSCNGKLFLNGLGVGFDGKIVRDLSGKKKVSGKFSYKLSVLKNILFFRSFQCRMKDADHNLEQQCLMISVANGKRYGGGFYVTPEAIIDDALFDVNVVGQMHSLTRIRYFPVIEKGKHRKLPFIKYFQTNKFSIESKEILPAHLDGEFLSSDQFVIECLPKKFSFIC